MSGKIPALHFDTDELPPGGRFEIWCGSLPEYEVLHPVGADPDAFRATSDVWFLGDVVLGTGRLSAARFVRSAERITDGCDQFSLLMLKEGGWTGDVDGRAVTAGPGQIVMFDMARPMDAAGIASDSITLRLARAQIAAAGGGRNLHGLMFEGQIGRVLADHLMMLVRYLPHADAGEAAGLGAAVMATIASCIAASPESGDPHEPGRDLAVRHRVGRYIDGHLGQPELTVASICRDLGMSRSVLYRAFEPLGGIANHILSRRLEAAHVMLENPSVDAAISAIAAGFGFVSDAHFSRVFRDRYGYSPRRARNGKAALREVSPVAGTPMAPALFRQWLAQLD